MATSSKVIANNDVVHIAWSYDQPMAGCAGFLIERQPADGSIGLGDTRLAGRIRGAPEIPRSP